MMKKGLFFLPLIVFFVLLALLYNGLERDPSVIPSPFIGKPAPSFTLHELDSNEPINPILKYQESVWVMNVWASWCLACRQEHPVLMQFRSRYPDLILVGLNYKDAIADARNWLVEFDNPYTISLVDSQGATGIEWGVYGVPETFIIDKNGIIRHKHIGPLSLDDLRQSLIPLLEKLASE